MTRTLWLHCGAFKSGSSRIQNEAHARRESLLRDGWLYPESGLVTDEPEVGHRHSRLVYSFRRTEEWGRLVDDLVREVLAADAPRVLLSSEAWSRPGAGASLARLLEELADRAGVTDVHAVLYVRNRFSYARSLYRELTRRRDNRLPLDGFVAAHDGPLDPLRTVRALRRALDRAQPRGRLTVVPYEEAGDTATHFFGLLDIAVPPAPFANLGLGAVEVEAHRQLKLWAPELRDHFPGLAALAPPGLDGAGHAERFGPGQLVSSASWRAELAAATGWTGDQVERVVARPPEPAYDVLELSPVLSDGARRWLESRCTPRIEVTTYPHPAVEELALDPVAQPGGAVRFSGCLLPRPGAATGRLLVVDDAGERETTTGQRSPAFGRRHRGRPGAGRSRFGAPVLALGHPGRADLVLAGERGERSVLAVCRRRWDPPRPVPG